MTRISSYQMFKCGGCGQVHVKPNYSSVSIHVPWDLNIDENSMLTCCGCGIKNRFSTFVLIGVWRQPEEKLPNWLTGKKPNFFERIFGKRHGWSVTEPPYPFLKK